MLILLYLAREWSIQGLIDGLSFEPKRPRNLRCLLPSLPPHFQKNSCFRTHLLRLTTLMPSGTPGRMIILDASRTGRRCLFLSCIA